MSFKIPNLKLNNGASIPALGFGTYAGSNASEGAIRDAVLTALETGYRHIDGAWSYGNEKEVGDGIRQFLSQSPGVKRDDIFVTSKVAPHFMEPGDLEWSVNDSLEKLGLDYVDCLLLHWPFVAARSADNKPKRNENNKIIVRKDLTETLEPTWRAMEKVYKAGKAKSIGISNFSIGRTKKVLNYAEIKPAINQIEIHPYLPQTELINYLFKSDVLPVAYSPLGSQMPNLTTEPLLKSAELGSLAEKKGISLAQLLLSWGVKRGYAVIPKSATPSRVKSNFGLVDLTEEEISAVSKATNGRVERFVPCPPIDLELDLWSD